MWIYSNVIKNQYQINIRHKNLTYQNYKIAFTIISSKHFFSILRAIKLKDV